MAGGFIKLYERPPCSSGFLRRIGHSCVVTTRYEHCQRRGISPGSPGGSRGSTAASSIVRYSKTSEYVGLLRVVCTRGPTPLWCSHWGDTVSSRYSLRSYADADIPAVSTCLSFQAWAHSYEKISHLTVFLPPQSKVNFIVLQNKLRTNERVRFSNLTI